MPEYEEPDRDGGCQHHDGQPYPLHADDQAVFAPEAKAAASTALMPPGVVAR